MAKDCIDILKNNLLEIADSDDRPELQEIFSREIEIPVTGEYNVEEDPYSYRIDDYMTEETRKILLDE